MKSFLLAIFIGISFDASAMPVRWELVDFRFNDGGTAYGSFTYDSDSNELSQIDVFTTSGSMLSGRHFVSAAGAWGRRPESGVLAFSDNTGPDFTGAGWFRIDASIDFNASIGTIANQWLSVGAESFCTNSLCSTAANEITDPGQSRNTISGYLLATAPVPEPSPIVLSLAGLSILAIRRASAQRGKKSPA